MEILELLIDILYWECTSIRKRYGMLFLPTLRKPGLAALGAVRVLFYTVSPALFQNADFLNKQPCQEGNV